MYTVFHVNVKLTGVRPFTLTHKIFVHVQALYLTCFQALNEAISIQPQSFQRQSFR